MPGVKIKSYWLEIIESYFEKKMNMQAEASASEGVTQ